MENSVFSSLTNAILVSMHACILGGKYSPHSPTCTKHILLFHLRAIKIDLLAIQLLLQGVSPEFNYILKVILPSSLLLRCSLSASVPVLPLPVAFYNPSNQGLLYRKMNVTFVSLINLTYPTFTYDATEERLFYLVIVCIQ